MVKKIESVYQVVFVMEDGAELAWKIFHDAASWVKYVDHLPREAMTKLGISGVKYRVVLVE